jgi:ubiquinone/menaquinone biosynthesis C-methylase UbiE
MSRRVRQISKNIANILPHGPILFLDVGAGSGEMAAAVVKRRNEFVASGVDIYIRPKTFIPVLKYDGCTLPFNDNSFDFVTIIDVLHHCEDPVKVLKECARVSKQFLVIKDHVCDSEIDRMILSFMDWIGNRAHGVKLPYNYLSSNSWNTAIARANLDIINSVDSIQIYPFPIDYFFGRKLHNLLLLRKK